MRNISQQTKIKQLTGLIDTKDLSAWENTFTTSIAGQVHAKRTLSEKQEEVINKLYERYFG